jgi:hypothetical protein
LVSYDADLEPKLDVAYGTTSNIKEWSRVDHLLAALCINRRPKFKTPASKRSTGTGDREVRKMVTDGNIANTERKYCEY